MRLPRIVPLWHPLQHLPRRFPFPLQLPKKQLRQFHAFVLHNVGRRNKTICAAPCNNAQTLNRMWKLLRYYWLTAKGYRLNPWNSPYLRWRFETFLGAEADHLTASKFFKLSWKYREQLERFLYWADERRKIQRRKR